MTRGVLVLAVGPPRYHDMARWLLASIRRVEPDLALAVATDAPRRLADSADEIIPVRVPDAGAYGLKLSLNLLSPFERTLQLDVDSLMVRAVPELWDWFADTPVGVLGYNVDHGTWFGRDLATLCRELGVATLPRFNGGLVCFDRSEQADRVFAAARENLSRYFELGFAAFRGSRADEPMLSVALAQHGLAAHHDQELAFFRTTRSATGEVDLDVLAGHCELTLDGVRVRPRILHFPSGDKSPVYAREAAEVMRAVDRPLTGRSLLRRR